MTPVRSTVKSLCRRGAALGSVAIVALLAMMAVPGVAFAAEWYEPTPAPGAVVGNQNIVIAYASDPVNPIVSGKLVINGFECTPLQVYIDPLFTSLSFDPSQPGAFPSPLPTGVNNAVATVTLLDGSTSEYAWSYTVDAPPAVVSVSPAEGQLVTYSQAPTITVTVSDPDDTSFSAVNGFIMRVDGSNVTPIWNGATQTYTYKRTFPPLPPWPNNTTHTVVFNVGDAAGNVVSKTWSFTVDTSPDSTKPLLSGPAPAPGSTTAPRPTLSINATDNRPGNLTVRFTIDGTEVYSGANPQGVTSWTPTSDLAAGTHQVVATAADAAGNVSDPTTWSFTVEDTMVIKHTTTTAFTSCSECHSSLLTTEHTNHGFDCNTCHGAGASQTVKDAIANNDTACGACHASADHASLHDGGIPSTNCAQCHQANISAEHGNDCDKCHQSTDSKVVAAIAGHVVTCTACHPTYHNGGQPYSGAADPSQGAQTYVYMKWGDIKAPEVLANTGSPHGGYVTTSVKCAVCHSTHRAAPGKDAAGTVVADTLLRFKASDSCGYCHVAAGSTVVDPVYGGVWPIPAEAGHALASPTCGECHASVHGANAETIPPVAGLLLKTKVAEEIASRAYEGLDYNTSIIDRVTAIEASAVAAGYGADPKVTGFNVSEYNSLSTNAIRQQAVGVFCGGCHIGSYAGTVAGARAGAESGTLLGTSPYSGHRTMAAATDNWNATGAISSGGTGATPGTGFKIADVAAQDCKGCHDSYNGFGTGTKAFPHNWGTAGDEPLELVGGVFENQSMTWLLAAPDSSAEPTRNGGAIGKAGHAGPAGGTLSDGVCLKCHKWTDGGVGASF